MPSLTLVTVSIVVVVVVVVVIVVVVVVVVVVVAAVTRGGGVDGFTLAGVTDSVASTLGGCPPGAMPPTCTFG